MLVQRRGVSGPGGGGVPRALWSPQLSTLGRVGRHATVTVALSSGFVSTHF